MREKLIEILLGWGGLSNCAEDMADYLIANGVTIPVRCKDCRYCLSDVYGLWCFNDYEHSLQPDDFCSYGERKTDG